MLMGKDELRFQGGSDWPGHDVLADIITSRGQRRINLPQRGRAEAIVRTHYDSVRVEEVQYSGSLSQELRVRSDGKGVPERSVAKQRLPQRFTRANGYGALLDDHFSPVHGRSNLLR